MTAKDRNVKKECKTDFKIFLQVEKSSGLVKGEEVLRSPGLDEVQHMSLVIADQ